MTSQPTPQQDNHFPTWGDHLSNNSLSFQAVAVPIVFYGCTILTLTKRIEKKLDENSSRMLLQQHPIKLNTYLKNHPSNINTKCRTLLEKCNGMNSLSHKQQQVLLFS